MILFFDRSLGTGIPLAIKRLKNFPCEIQMHKEHFVADANDDEWLPVIGRKGWTVIGQDYSYHKNQSELYAIRTYKVGVFYLWGANAIQWEQFRVLARAWDRICEASANTPRPFAYRVTKDGRLVKLLLP